MKIIPFIIIVIVVVIFTYKNRNKKGDNSDWDNLDFD